MLPSRWMIPLVVLWGCDPEDSEPTPINDLDLSIEPRTVDLGSFSYGTNVIPRASYLFTNNSRELVFLVPDLFEGIEGEGADLLRTNFAPYTEVQPEQSRPIELSIDPRRWRWRSGTYEIFVPLEVSYFFQPPSGFLELSQPSQRVRDITTGDARLKIQFEIDCDLDGDGYEAMECGGDDCDDNDPDVNPGEAPDCDMAGIDNNCSGSIDDPGALNATNWYVDADGDGYGVGEPFAACRRPAVGRWADRAGDCDDTSANANPGVPIEVFCNDGLDNDCNGFIDAADPACPDN